MSTIYKYLALFGGFCVTVLLVVVQSLRLNSKSRELDDAEAESEALHRQSEGLIAGQKAYDEITDTELDRNHFTKRRVLSLHGRRKDSDS